MRRNERKRLFGLMCMLCICLLVRAQDPLPGMAPRDRNSGPVYGSPAMRNLMKYMPVTDSMPSSFLETQENRITDPENELRPFWEKISRMDGPVRIVHIGDSHVRGHLYPYVVRKLLEEDFGGDAVLDMQVTYRTSGLAHETGAPGIVYHILGVNGSTCGTFSTPEKIREITELNPDLVIVSFGTNEAHGRRYSPAEHCNAMDSLLLQLRKGCPGTAFLLTTPPGAYVRNGRRGARVINPRTPLVVKTEKEYAASRGIALWNLYDIAGGKRYACRNWNAGHYYQHDRIHFTAEGYRLQGLLLHEAIIKAYNDYVETQLGGIGN